jgi:pilus assembly protein FimV
MSPSDIFTKLVCKYLHVILFVCLLIPAATDAAGLGKLKVKSYLGETLDADIELVETTADEFPSLTARLANADEYIAAGLQDSAIPTGIRVNAVQHADGQWILHLTSTGPINEPFLELLISVNSETLHLVRQYTVLLDPPNSKLDDGGNPLPSSANPSPIGSRSYDAINPSEVTSTTGSSLPQPVARTRKKFMEVDARISASEINHAAMSKVSVPAAENQLKPRQQTIEPNSSSIIQNESQTYLTQKGDIFGKVAQQYQPAGVSLKHVMTALYKANPDAFLEGDINQLKAGQVLHIPEIVGAPFRRSEAASTLAEAKPAGKVDTNFADKANAHPGFFLKISPGNTSTKIDEQDNNQARINQAMPSVPAPIPLTQAVPVPATPIEPLNAQHSDPVGVVVAPSVDPAAIVTPKSKIVSDAVTSTPKQNWLNNILWILIGMMIPVTIFLLAFVLNIRRQAKMRRLQESVFGSIQASKSNAVNADIIYGQEPAELDQASSDAQNEPLLQASHPHDQTIIDIDEIDPLVEAEIYISYGRDEQAESILKHALEATPSRHELSYRLLVIYAGRPDLESFERYAKVVKDAAVLGGQEDITIWDKVAILGGQIDAENPLYKTEVMQSDAVENDGELPEHQNVAYYDLIAEEEIDPFSDASIASAETLEFPPLEVIETTGKHFEQLASSDAPELIEVENALLESSQIKQEESVLEFTLPEDPSQSTAPQLAVVKTPSNSNAKK